LLIFLFYLVVRDDCTICLVECVDGDAMRVLPCLHSFHVACIVRGGGSMRICLMRA
jgi:hypothetical protein